LAERANNFVRLHGWWLVAGGWWLVAGGWWLVAGGWYISMRFVLMKPQACRIALPVRMTADGRCYFDWHELRRSIRPAEPPRIRPRQNEIFRLFLVASLHSTPMKDCVAMSKSLIYKEKPRR